MAQILIAAAILLIIILVLICIYDSNRFVQVEYNVRSDKIKKEITLVLLSDLHNKSYGRHNEKLVRAIDGISPDGILAAGDMLTATQNSRYDVPLRLLEELARRYPIYYGIGNHEHKLRTEAEEYGDIYEDYMERLNRIGVETLINSRIYLPGTNVEICGAEIHHFFYKRFYKRPMQEGYLDKLMGPASKDRFELLIAHNPEYFKEYADWGADLVVSGHVHGGVVKLPFVGGVISPMLRLFPKYDGGRYTCGTTTMIESRGLGMHTMPVRLFNPGELAILRLGPTGKGND